MFLSKRIQKITFALLMLVMLATSVSVALIISLEKGNNKESNQTANYNKFKFFPIAANNVEVSNSIKHHVDNNFYVTHQVDEGKITRALPNIVKKIISERISISEKNEFQTSLYYNINHQEKAIRVVVNWWFLSEPDRIYNSQFKIKWMV